jgi:hypothetical protein
VKGLYVYALVPPDLDAALGAGLVGEPLVLLALGPLAAVAGEIDDPPSIAPASLRMHDEIVRGIARASDAILPFRFGATVLDPGELAQGLAPRMDALAAALERTRGCDQMTLRLYAEAPPRQGPPSDAGPGTRWLRERATQQVAAAPEVVRVREALAPLVRAEAIEGSDAPPLRASLFHLVERRRLTEYRAAVETLGAALAPARVATTGPWPPYAFTEIE